MLRFVENGGYALAAYDQWRKLFRDSEGRVHVRSARIAARHRMNIGTIVEAPMLKVRLVGKRSAFGPVLGEIEEYFVSLLRPGDTFMFAGRLLRFLRLHEMAVECAGRRRRRTDGAGLRRRPPAADHQPRRPRARAAAGPVAAGTLFPEPGAGMAAAATRRVSHCPAATTCWWRRFRAAIAGTWSPTASRAATRTRRWACC